MSDSYLLLLLCAPLVSASLTWLARRNALSRGIIDHPNARSSHSSATPRGGGSSIVIVATIGTAILWYTGVVDTQLLLVMVVGGSAVAIVGYMDDRGSLPVLVRIAVHCAAAIWATFTLGGLPAIQLGNTVVDLGIAGDVLAVLAIVWMINLFNFMDGIDGIAASEAVFVTVAGATLCYIAGASSSVAFTALMVAAASLGFLIWNWPPAKIFMGDVGSGYLGYVIAVLALGAARESRVALYAWLILGSVFVVDSTVTLLRRLGRGERIYEAHRCHAYQWLARRWGSHRSVTVAVLVIDAIWLLPLASLSVVRPQLAVWATIAALVPLAALAVVAGAGRSENRDAAGNSGKPEHQR